MTKGFIPSHLRLMNDEPIPKQYRLPRKIKKMLKQAFGPIAYTIWRYETWVRTHPLDLASELAAMLAAEIDREILQRIMTLGNNDDDFTL